MSKRSLGAAAAAAAVLLTGCGAGNTTRTEPAPPSQGASASASPAAKSFNQADVSFARNMIPHHEQAIAMADMVAGHTDNAQLRDLAAEIRAAQQPEIATLTGWLKEWNAAPAGSGHASAGHPGGSGQHDMAGMMSEKDMAALKKARGAAFDEMWLRMMIEHHEGAVDMARTELDKGRHDGARQLARRIVEAQRAEIATMRGMLARS